MRNVPPFPISKLRVLEPVLCNANLAIVPSLTLTLVPLTGKTIVPIPRLPLESRRTLSDPAVLN